MPLPLTVSCLSKIQIVFTFLVPVLAHSGSPGQRAFKRLCVYYHFFNMWEKFSRQWLSHVYQVAGRLHCTHLTVSVTIQMSLVWNYNRK